MKINLENIIHEFRLFAGNLNNVDEQKLVSFAFHFEKSDQLISFDKLNVISDDIFLFRTPNNQLTIASINSAINLLPTNANNFSSVANNYNYWKKNFINNWNQVNAITVPIICCSAKFDPISSSSLWNEFDPLRIFMPEFILASRGDKSVGYYNFIFDGNNKIDKYLEKFSFYLENLSGEGTQASDNIR